MVAWRPSCLHCMHICSPYGVLPVLMRAWKRETPRKLTSKLASYLTATWVVRGLGLGIPLLCKAGM